jgi:hypothetical protein
MDFQQFIGGRTRVGILRNQGQRLPDSIVAFAVEARPKKKVRRP